MQMTGAKILMECLLEQGVDTVFGYPGGTILNVYDELYNYGGKVRHILTAHEQGASHAAGRLCPLHRQGGRMLRHLGPRLHQPHHRHCHGLYGLVACGLHHLQCQREPHRQGLLPGGGHHRHHHAHHQVQLHGAGRHPAGRHRPRGFCHRPGRQTGAGAHRYREERHRRDGGVHPPAPGGARQRRPPGRPHQARLPRFEAPRARQWATWKSWPR